MLRTGRATKQGQAGEEEEHVTLESLEVCLSERQSGEDKRTFQSGSTVLNASGLESPGMC